MRHHCPLPPDPRRARGPTREVRGITTSRARTRALRVVAGLAAVGLGAASLAACGPRQTGPNVILVVIDTLRADRLSAYGNRQGLTPFLDELAARGTVFAEAHSQTSWTNPSVASLFTSRYPSQTRISAFDSRLAADETTLAEILTERGYRCAGFLANWRLKANLGFAQGFEVWHPYFEGVKVRGDLVARRTLQWLDENGRRAAPLLLYLHFMEPHGPYQPPARFRDRLGDRAPSEKAEAEANQKLVDMDYGNLSDAEVRQLEGLYDGEVAAIDYQLRLLFDELGRRGVLDDAFVIVTADHGEEFRDHGGLAHGRTLYEEMIRVPLIVTGPGIPAGRVVDENVALVDVAPTLLALLHVPIPSTFEGRSLVPLIEGGHQQADVLAELLRTTNPIDARRHSAALVHRSLKLLVSAKAEDGGDAVYDLEKDPGETTPNPPELAGEAESLAAALTAEQRQLAEKAGKAERGHVDAETRERLRQLGYAE